MVNQLVMVGLMGCGKTTVGKLVAKESGREFVDVDDAIATRTGKTVRELWEAGGEVAYRDMESEEVLQALQADSPIALAAPGGSVLDPAVRTTLAGNVAVWLRADPAVLATRVRPDDHRPLLAEHPKTVLTEMSRSRSHLYELVATAIIDTDLLGPHKIAEQVLELLAPVSGPTY